MGWKSSLLLLALIIMLFGIIPKSESIVTTGSDKIQKRIPPFSLPKDMNNDRCDPPTCSKSCDGYCMREHSSVKDCTRSGQVDDNLSINYANEDKTSTLKENATASLERDSSDRLDPYYPHTECLCAKSAKRVKYSACYTHNNPPPDPAEGGDYSQVKAFEECQYHCSMRVDGFYSGKSDEKEELRDPHESSKIYGALCDTNFNGRVQRFCYCVSFPFQPPPQHGDGWGEDGGWSSHSEDHAHGWNSPPSGNGWHSQPNGTGWSSPPIESGWSSPPSGSGWNSPPHGNGWNVQPGWSPPSTANGWTSPGSPHNPPTAPSGWNAPTSGPENPPVSSHPPPAPNGWNSPTTGQEHPPPAPSGWNSPTSGQEHPPSAPSGWTPPPPPPAPHHPGNGWNSSTATGTGWTPPTSGHGWNSSLLGAGWHHVGWSPAEETKSPNGLSGKVTTAEVEEHLTEEADGKIPSRHPVSNSSTTTDTKVPFLAHSATLKPAKVPGKGTPHGPVKNPAPRPAVGKSPSNKDIKDTIMIPISQLFATT